MPLIAQSCSAAVYILHECSEKTLMTLPMHGAKVGRLVFQQGDRSNGSEFTRPSQPADATGEAGRFGKCTMWLFVHSYSGWVVGKETKGLVMVSLVSDKLHLLYCPQLQVHLLRAVCSIMASSTSYWDARLHARIPRAKVRARGSPRGPEEVTWRNGQST